MYRQVDTDGSDRLTMQTSGFWWRSKRDRRPAWSRFEQCSWFGDSAVLPPGTTRRVLFSEPSSRRTSRHCSIAAARIPSSWATRTLAMAASHSTRAPMARHFSLFWSIASDQDCFSWTNRSRRCRHSGSWCCSRTCGTSIGRQVAVHCRDALANPAHVSRCRSGRLRRQGADPSETGGHASLPDYARDPPESRELLEAPADRRRIATFSSSAAA